MRPNYRSKQLSMATTVWVIWLCACVRYWIDRGLMFGCVTGLYCLFHTWRNHKLCPEGSSGLLISGWSAAASRWPRNLGTLFWIWGKKSIVERDRDFEWWPGESALLGRTRLGNWLFDNLNSLSQHPGQTPCLEIWRLAPKAVETPAIHNRLHPSPWQWAITAN